MKLDVMDKATNVLDIFPRRVSPLKLTYIGVAHRNLQNNHLRGRLQDTVECEAEFLRDRSAYKIITRCDAV